MIVDRKDGACRTCDSALEIVDVDDASLLVRCTECDDTYLVESDAFGDGCMTYYLGAMARKIDEGESP